ncbi:hypothetical protein ACLB1S_14345 [Escherichia coli]
MVRASDKNDTENVKKALMIINPTERNPDAYYWGLINDEDALKVIFKRSNIRMAGNVCNQMSKCCFALSLLLKSARNCKCWMKATLLHLKDDIATFDLAIMQTIPRLKGISANLRKQLINSNDEQTIENYGEIYA